jgi:hypothetical protein
MAQPAKAKSGVAGVIVPITITNSTPSKPDARCDQGDTIQFKATDQAYVVAFDNFPLGIALEINQPESFPVVKHDFIVHYGVSVPTAAAAARVLDAPYRIQGGGGNEGGRKK